MSTVVRLYQKPPQAKGGLSRQNSNPPLRTPLPSSFDTLKAISTEILRGIWGFVTFLGRVTRSILSRISLSALLLLASPALVGAQDKVYQWSLVAAAATHTADITTTAHCIGRGTCREANPTLRWANDNPAGLGLAKGALAGSLHLAIHRLLWRRGYKWQAIASNAIVIGVTVGVTARNTRF